MEAVEKNRGKTQAVYIKKEQKWVPYSSFKRSTHKIPSEWQARRKKNIWNSERRKLCSKCLPLSR